MAIDATPVISGRTGIALYVAELIAALREHQVEVAPFAIGRSGLDVPTDYVRVRTPARIVHASWSMGGPPHPERLVRSATVVHATGLVPPPTRLPVVATVHDLTPLDHPDLHPPRLVRQAEALLRQLGRADVVAAVSAATAEVLNRHGVARDQIVVTHPGPPDLGPPEVGRVVGGPYLLAVGEQAPRKGLLTLLEAFEAAGLGGVRLVHTGPPSSHTRELECCVERLGLSHRVSFLGFVARPRLAALYRDALALCYPSRAEGFGLPVLEALRLGLPVVASDIPPVREVAGESALLVDPTDTSTWALALHRVVTDDALRAKLAAAGPARASLFSWDRCARETIAAYRLAEGP